MIIPSIDLMDGKAVQLKQGRKKMLERKDVLELAKEFGRYGEIAVIDLDAAMDKKDNIELIKEILKIADCRVGGGIRTIEKGKELLRCGAKRIIIGTTASKKFLCNFRKEDVIVAIDTRNGRITDCGWKRETNFTPEEKIEELKDYCSGFLFTNVEKEGKLEGFDMELAREIKKIVPNNLTVAGGITTIDEIKEIEKLGMDCQIGMAIYTGKIKLPDAFASLVDFEKGGSLVPTIVQEENGQVLMLAYSNRESLITTLKTGHTTYYSRSRKKLWTKGEESGNFQDLVKVNYDCDRDTLLFRVRQKGVACHEGKYSCFGERDFNLEELYNMLASRISGKDNKSYTYKISKNEAKLLNKIAEESQEVINYANRENLVWEIADLTYFLLTLMAKKEIKPREILMELRGRRR
ncbi:MAG: bifunctional phosphoribosyl-AMP cyclohydrolase/phosphoribosyl-ATP diphosphatase HisIE [Candidatus Methanofastidiosia archaeon]